jgi:hypothetical protein
MLEEGLYRVKAEGHLRNDDAQHTVKRDLTPGQKVLVAETHLNGRDQPHRYTFSTGVLSKEHSWVKHVYMPPNNVEAMGNTEGWVVDDILGEREL